MASNPKAFFDMSIGGQPAGRIIFTEGLDGKHVGFDKVVEAMNVLKAFVDVVKALSDVVTVLERAGWRTSSIVIIIVIMIMIIKAAA